MTAYLHRVLQPHPDLRLPWLCAGVKQVKGCCGVRAVVQVLYVVGSTRYWNISKVHDGKEILHKEMSVSHSFSDSGVSKGLQGGETKQLNSNN